jgi:hypothetical protein
VDYSGPVLRLANLTPEDLFVLLGKLRHVYASGVVDHYLIPDEGLKAFMHHCSKKIGDAYFRTPRNTITGFVNLLAVLEQNPGVSWQQLLDQVQVLPETNLDLQPLDSEADEDEQPLQGSAAKAGDDDLASFKL